MSFLLILLSAILFIIPFFNPGLFFTAWLALIPALFSLLTRKEKIWKSFSKGWLLGTLLWAGTGYWLYLPLKGFTELPLISIIFLLLFLFSGMGFIYGFWSWSLVKLQQGNNFRPFFLACSWVGFEYLRYRIFNFYLLGFTAYSQSDFGFLLQFAEYGGIFLVTFIVILFNGYLYKFFKSGQGRYLIIFLILIILVSGIGFYQKNNFSGKENKIIKAGIVPTRISQKDKWLPKNIEKNINNLFQEIKKVDDSKIIFTPETSLTFDIMRNGYYKNIFDKKMESVSSYLQVGSQTVGEENISDRKYNSSFLINPEGEIQNRYNKNHLVLFGEYIPFRNLVNDIAGTGLQSLIPGDRVEIFQTEFASWKALICSEILKPLYSQKKIEEVDFLINQSNEAWYNNDNLKNQMWAASLFRAVENRRSVVRAGNDAFNGLILPEGESAQKNTASTSSFQVNIKLNRSQTLYQKWGNYTGYISLIIWSILIFIKLLVWFLRRRKKQEQ